MDSELLFEILKETVKEGETNKKEQWRRTKFVIQDYMIEELRQSGDDTILVYDSEFLVEHFKKKCGNQKKFDSVLKKCIEMTFVVEGFINRDERLLIKRNYERFPIKKYPYIEEKPGSKHKYFVKHKNTSPIDVFLLLNSYIEESISKRKEEGKVNVKHL